MIARSDIKDRVLRTKWTNFYYRSLEFATIIYLTKKIKEYTEFIISKNFWDPSQKQARATDEILNKVRGEGERELADLIDSLRNDKGKLKAPAKEMAKKYLKLKTSVPEEKNIVENYKSNTELKSQLDQYITNIQEIGFKNYLNKLNSNEVKCSYCGDIIRWHKDIQSGLDRAGFDKIERSYEITDSIPCCSNCNNLKGTRKWTEFHVTINKIHNHSTHLSLENFIQHLRNRNDEIKNILNDSLDKSTQALQVKTDQAEAAAAAAEPTVAQVRIKNRIIKTSKLLSNKEDRLNNIKKLFKIATNNSLDDIFRGEPQHGVHIHDRNPDGSEGPVIFDSGYELGQEYEENMNERNLFNIQDNIIQGYNNNSLPTHIENELLHLLNTHDLDKAALILAKKLNKPNDDDSNLNIPHDNDDIPF